MKTTKSYTLHKLVTAKVSLNKKPVYVGTLEKGDKPSRCHPYFTPICDSKTQHTRMNGAMSLSYSKQPLLPNSTIYGNPWWRYISLRAARMFLWGACSNHSNCLCINYTYIHIYIFFFLFHRQRNFYGKQMFVGDKFLWVEIFVGDKFLWETNFRGRQIFVGSLAHKN